MSTPFLTLDPRTSPLHFSPHLSPESPNNSDSDYTDSVSPLTPSPVGQHEPYRLSGFNAFNFGLSPVSPEATSQPHPTASTASLVPPIPPRASPPPPIVIPQQQASAPIVQSNALPGGVHREAPADVLPDEPAPPPYERYKRRSMPHGGVRASRANIAAHQLPTDLTIPAPAHQRSGAGGGPRRFSGQRHIYPLALRGGGGDLTRDNSQKRKPSWRIFGGEEPVAEKRTHISRAGKWVIGIVAAIMLIAVIVVGAVFGTMGRTKAARADADAKAGNTLMPFDPVKFPALPTGVVVVAPQDAPQMPAAACVKPRTLWSCSLPKDTSFPSNSSTGQVLPEFIFTIALRNASNDHPGSWKPVPALVPNDTEYAAVADADGIVSDNKVGELTQFYVSLQTDANKPINIASADGEEGDAGVEKRQAPSSDTAMMLPALLRNMQLRLFDRGLDTEHYGFFVNYKKSINVLAATPEQVTADTELADSPSGVVAGSAGAKQVVWEGTRFRVVIWTKMRTGGARDLIGEGGQRLSSVPVKGERFPYVVSVFEDRVGERGGVSWTQDGELAKNDVVEEDTVGGKGCFCEWRNWREGLN